MEGTGLQLVAIQAFDWQQHKWTDICTILFHFIFHFPSQPFSLNGRSKQKSYLAKVDGRAQIHSVRPLSRHCQPFGVPWWPFWIWQAVIECPLCRMAGIMTEDIQKKSLAHVGYPINSDLQAGIWFGNVAPNPIITIPHSSWFSCSCLKSRLF